jgi:hypothetical protein
LGCEVTIYRVKAIGGRNGFSEFFFFYSFGLCMNLEESLGKFIVAPSILIVDSLSLEFIWSKELYSLLEIQKKRKRILISIKG